MKIKEVMRNAKIISPDATAKEAAVLMSCQHIGSLIVVDKDEKVAGIVTERDIISKVTAENKIPNKVSVWQIMSPKVITIGPNDMLDDAVYLMIQHKIKKLPVVDDDELVGIITSTDIVANSSEIGEFYLF